VLRRLRIENLVLIREAELELAPGLVALTGETGAGKTIVTQALGLLLGAKGDAASVGAAGTEAYVEAELDVPDGFFDEDGVEALRDASSLARSRYDTGLANYLEILTADQQLFDQELQLAQVRGEEMRAFVELYRALGGGWQTEPAAPAPTTEPPPPPAPPS
jgi:DNA repair ATPase RecN